MKCLVIGSGGQLGRALQARAPAGAEVIAPAEADCDLTNAAHMKRWIEDAGPDIIFNAAAYTNVDGAERDAAAAKLVNATSVGRIAEAAARTGTRLIHVSTDFVFDGEANRPYVSDDLPNPLSVYGRTKLDGERAIADAGADALIVRTAWVYAEQGRNFVLTMLRLMSERDEIKVVADQFGTPTYVGDLADCLWRLAPHGDAGIYHFTNEGSGSWYDFAVAIQEEAVAVEILKKAAAVLPIAARDYPTPAARPRFSVLDKSKTRAVLGGNGRHWRGALREMLARLASAG
jgi:dTDP-4-dehydrorhamnose reductase